MDIIQRFCYMFIPRRQRQCSIDAGEETLSQLREFEKRAADFQELSRKDEHDPTVIELLVNSGVARSFWLHDSPDVSVARTVFSDGAYFGDHVHDQFEAWVVYRGHLNVTVDGVRVDRPDKRVYFVYPGSVHSVEAVGETEVIVTTVPRSDAFPSGPNMNG